MIHMITNINEGDSVKIDKNDSTKIDEDDFMQLHFDEFKLLAEQGREYFNSFLYALAIYLAVYGLIVKCFLDASAGSQARIYYFIFGVLINIAAIVMITIAISFYKPMAKRHRDLSKAINVADLYFPITLNSAKMIFGLNIGFLLAWVSLFFLF